MSVTMSVIIPVKNGEKFIGECLNSLLRQDYQGTWEISIYNDGSEDSTEAIIRQFEQSFNDRNVPLVINSGEVSGGVGFAKNKAVAHSSGKYVCFCDADDMSHEKRLSTLVKYALSFPEHANVFFGSCFRRTPEHSTVRYTRWACSLTNELLDRQIYTSHGPTLIAPTWFLSRTLFDQVGGFRDDIKKGFPEDLDFFYKTFSCKHVIYRKIDEELVVYRYHSDCESFSVHEDSIWELRLEHLRKNVLLKWQKFSIWSVGKQGKHFFKSLRPEEKNNVVAFCDVDIKKLNRGVFENYDEVTRTVIHKIPILSIENVQPPVIICVKLDMTGGDLEKLIASKNWIEGEDYIFFT
ncbi:unnamed protein product [Auanema sp. JU1783]|nr:unnamed protein product [Auanema sp. JU1783]